jgi:PAS domain S-box-containing protein
MRSIRVESSELDATAGDDPLLKVFRTCPVALTISRWSDRTFVDANAAFTRLTGWTRDDVHGRTSLDLGLVSQSDADPVRAQLSENQTIRDRELTLRTRDGQARSVLMASELIELRGERHAVSTFVDITARKELDLRTSRLAAIVRSSDDAIIGKDLAGTVTSWNAGAEMIFGYAADEMIGRSIMTLVPDDRADEEARLLASIARGRGISHLETIRRTKDGRMLDVSITTSPIRDSSGTVVGASTIARDISDRKRLEKERQVADARYRALFVTAPVGIIISDAESVYVDVNPSMCAMLGYAREELIGMHGSELVAPSETQYIRQALDTIERGVPYQREWQFRRRDGSTFRADVIGAPMPDGHALGVVRDITERVKSEARFRRLIDSNAQGVMFWNASAAVTDANDAFLAMVGATREDLLAGRLNWLTMTPPEYAEADARAVHQLAATGVCTPYEKEYTRSDGSRVPVLVGAATFADDADEGVAFIVDLTEKKRLERQVLRAQRMESVGTLAGGIAHDLNNVLAPILLSLALIKAEVKDERLVSLLDTVDECAQRGAELVQQVLSFARGVEGRHVPVDLLSLTRELLKVTRDTFPRTIDVRFEPATEVWPVLGDPTQIHQVLLNLLVNARDAMPHGGRVTISMENIVLDETYAAMNIDARAGSYVRIEVVDSGPGIPAELRDRIFEPFFTTKELGHGTGLGLSTSLAIVKSHGGFIHVYSEPGQGARFRVCWPATTSATGEAPAIAEARPLPRGNGELILVVDDEPAVRTIAKATLERFGYRVLLAANGAEAVAFFAAQRGDIAVVITDMAMPVLDGPAMVVALRAIDPSVKVIASSGMTANGDVAKMFGGGVEHFVPKPYTAETLLGTLDQVLRRTTP